MINIVTIGDSRYLVDVGFGANFCPIQPVKLIHDTAGFENVEPASARLLWKSISSSENQFQKLWVYQHRIGSDKEFEDQYCFTDTEFRPNDFQVMNWYTSTHPKAFFTQRIICNKMITEGDNDKIVGALLLQTALKRRVGKESEQILEFKTEEDRVKALKEHFDIDLSVVEQDAIKGTFTQIL
jgi:arylamine N-acetyltransferase